MYCKICGDENCKEHTFSLGKSIKIDQFTGSSPPEIFVGKWNYPNVYTGILSPQESGSTEVLSSPELWHKRQLKIPDILALRNRLVYGRTQNSIREKNKFISTMQEVARAYKSVSTDFIMKKPVQKNLENDAKVPIIKHAVEVSDIQLNENPKVKPKVEYLTSDTDSKSAPAIVELANSGIETSSIIKVLSAGLLGLEKNRKLVPTRWSITAVDDTLSKNYLEKIRFYPEISEIQLFSSEYLGNNYNFLLLPDKFSFEVIEISPNLKAWQDYEGFQGRKKYADSVTGAYYANRLALSEYLDKTKKQSSCLVFREVRQEYSAPLGVGILRQVSREAFSRPPEKCSSIHEALQKIQSRLRIPISLYTNKSILLKEFGKQSRLSSFFN